MEHLWSQAGATSGKHRQIGGPPKPLKPSQICAVSCVARLEAAAPIVQVDGRHGVLAYVEA
jgi:hypothetical protein